MKLGLFFIMLSGTIGVRGLFIVSFRNRFCVGGEICIVSNFVWLFLVNLVWMS